MFSKTAKEIADETIAKVKAMKHFEVERYMDEAPFSGKIPFSIKHSAGGPFRFSVYAVSQQDAEDQVNRWLDTLEDPEF